MGNPNVQSRVQGILNEELNPYRCECEVLRDASVVVCVHEPESPERCLTVAGISDSDCRNEATVRQLARSIRDDLLALFERHGLFAANPVPRDES